MPFDYGDDTGLYASGGWGLKWNVIGGCLGSVCYPSRPVNSREGQREDLSYRVRHCLRAFASEVYTLLVVATLVGWDLACTP